MLEWAYIGVNTSVPAAGGIECTGYLPLKRRIYETLLITSVFSYFAFWSWRKLLLPSGVCSRQPSPSLIRTLLFLHSFIFGIEIGFKLASQSLIWILNPCHVLTMIQLFLLISQPCRSVTAVFCIHMHMLNGPVLALVFPVLNTRQVGELCSGSHDLVGTYVDEAHKTFRRHSNEP
ncbi:Transmembrane protein [Fasciola gigantica]|uniref:Transmembrane protein n=1 Tax=Fasciola gigantica TaxID=46835 RepID=A0A504YVW2_FASGI|nr:Transmembrane protein [Fasciola gigantica]